MEKVHEQPVPCAFFCHIMKTGGTSLARLISSQIPDTRMIAPPLERDHFFAYVMNPLHWTGLFGDLTNVRYVAGHYPFLAHRLLPMPHTSFALFREPVERVVSHLGELQREEMPDRPIEDIYADPKIFAERLDNLQARVFAFDSTEASSLFEHTFDWSEARLELAFQRLDELDIIGLTSELPRFLRRLEGAFGWKLGKPPRLRAARPGEERPSPELVEQIRRDMVWDIRFYEGVMERYRRQSAPHPTRTLAPHGAA